jgi:hypothetical protein
MDGGKLGELIPSLIRNCHDPAALLIVPMPRHMFFQPNGEIGVAIVVLTS